MCEGFSGECVNRGRLLRCDDTELDPRVDRERCRDLGLRSILAVPVRIGEKSVGLIETLSEEPSTFTDNDGTVLQRFAETIVAAMNRAPVNRGDVPLEKTQCRSPREGPQLACRAFFFFLLHRAACSSLQSRNRKKRNRTKSRTTKSQSPTLTTRKMHGRIQMPRSLPPDFPDRLCHGDFLWRARLSSPHPLIQAKSKSTRIRRFSPPGLASPSSLRLGAEDLSVETANFTQLKQMAENGNAAAENALGLRYFQGDEKDNIAPDEGEAVRWFNKAAVHGNLAAQAKLGSPLLERTRRRKRCQSSLLLDRAGPRSRRRTKPRSRHHPRLRHDAQPVRRHRAASRCLAATTHANLETLRRPLDTIKILIKIEWRHPERARFYQRGGISLLAHRILLVLRLLRTRHESRILPTKAYQEV